MAHWNEESIEKLKRLHAAGHPASTIARMLGGFDGYFDSGRSAVIGKLFRLGLRCHGTRRALHKRIGGKIARRNKGKHQPHIWNKQTQPARAILNRDGLPLPSPAEFDVARVSFNDLEPHHCRFPCVEHVTGVPQDQPMFCGMKPFPGLPYCEVHAARAFLPLPPRKREDLHVVKNTETAEKELQVA